MRSLLFVLLLSIVLFNDIQSQTTLGAKAYTGRAWHGEVEGFLPDGYEDFISQYGFSLEVFRAINPKIAIGVAPGYVRRGTSFEAGFINGFGPPSFQAELNLNYLQLPFFFKLETEVYEPFHVFAQTGAGFSYLLNGWRKAIGLRESAPPFGPVDLDFENGDAEINRFDFGWHSEVGISCKIGRGAILLSGVYYHGFMDVDDKNESLNRNWSIGLGYQREFGGKK